MVQDRGSDLVGDELAGHLIGMERSLCLAEVRAKPEAVGVLLAEDFREFGASGRVWSRAEILDVLAADVSGEITSEGFVCQQLSAEVALLTYTSTDEATGRRALRSSVWRLEAGEWRMVFHQGTVIPSVQRIACFGGETLQPSGNG